MMNKNLLKQAQMLQARIAKAQDELGTLTTEASAGGGAVMVVVTGDQHVKSVKISKEAVNPEDVETLEDLVLAALSEALEKSRQLAAAHLQKATGGLNIPGLM